jgi:hypothetical protein
MKPIREPQMNTDLRGCRKLEFRTVEAVRSNDTFVESNCGGCRDAQRNGLNHILLRVLHSQSNDLPFDMEKYFL